jgi:hypothetical protein
MKLSLAVDLIAFLFKAIPELVELVDRWLSGEEPTKEDPIYGMVKERLDRALHGLEDEIDKLESLSGDKN